MCIHSYIMKILLFVPRAVWACGPVGASPSNLLGGGSLSKSARQVSKAGFIELAYQEGQVVGIRVRLTTSDDTTALYYSQISHHGRPCSSHATKSSS